MRVHGPIATDDVKTSFYLPPDLLAEAKAQAAEDRMSLRLWLIRTISRELRRQAKRAAAHAAVAR